MERAGDAEPDRAARALALGLDARLVDRRRLAGDHELAGAVVVRRPHVRDLLAQRLDRLVGEPEDRRHRAGMRVRGLGHREPALADERDRVARRRACRRAERRELADRVADDEIRARCRARAAPRRARATSRRAPAAAPRCRRAPRPAGRSRAPSGPCPEAALPSS